MVLNAWSLINCTVHPVFVLKRQSTQVAKFCILSASFRIVEHGWKFSSTKTTLLYVYLDRRRRRRKFLITTLLRAFGYSSDFDIFNLFYELQDMEVKGAEVGECVEPCLG
jgi:DNA-directed RNA polymerase beta subunit